MSQPVSTQLLSVPGQSPAHPIRPPFLHPSVSRLRSSVLNQRGRVPSSSTVRTTLSNAISPDPSHFSAISRASSVSGPPLPNEYAPNGEAQPKHAPAPLSRHHSDSNSVSTSAAVHTHEPEREVFRWTSLRHISAQVYSPASSAKAQAVLDAGIGRPTVVAAGGLICVGTHTGRTAVFDFRQQFKFICGADVPGSPPCYYISSSCGYLLRTPYGVSGCGCGLSAIVICGPHISSSGAYIRTHFPL